jgi:hypothetical protein
MENFENMSSFPAYYFFDALDGSDVIICPTDFMIRSHRTARDCQSGNVFVEYDPIALDQIMMGMIQSGDILERRIQSGLTQRMEIDREDIENFRTGVKEGNEVTIYGIAYSIMGEVLDDLGADENITQRNNEGWEAMGRDEDYDSQDDDDEDEF